MKKLIFIFYVITCFLFTLNVSANQLPPIVDFAADVDPHSGSANLSLPILTPQGRGGIQPNINLQYNSRLGNSHLGVGWLLEMGAVQITTTQGVPKYDGNDGFCLIQAGSTQGLVYDAGAGFYRTEIEGAFSKIEYDGTGDTWTITDKNGVKYFFGSTSAEREYDPADTTHVFRWNISKVEDVHGNYMTYIYTRDGNRLYPASIEYTGNSAQSLNPHANIVFSLEDRPDKQSSHIAGFERKQDKRIKDITVNVKIGGVDNLYRKYELIYAYSTNTNRSLLTDIKEIGADGVTALPTKQLTYSDDAVHTYSLLTISNNPASGDNLWYKRAAGGYDHGSSNYGPCPPPNMCFGGLNWQTEVKTGNSSNGDITFNGNKDTAYWIWTYLYVDTAKTITISDPMSGPEGIYLNGDYSTNVGYTWNLNAGYNRIDITAYHQNANFSFNLIENLVSQVDLMNTSQFNVPKIGADYDGDGLTDAGNFDTTNGNFEVSLSTSGGFVPQSTWITGFGAGKNALVGYFDNNGYIDIAVFDSNNDNWQFALSDGVSFTERSYMHSFDFTGSNKQVGATDLDSDGFTDLYATYNSGTDLILEGAENMFNIDTGIPYRFKTDEMFPQTYVIGPADAQAIPADFNADGLTDFASFDKPNGNWTIYLNPGDRNDDFVLLQTINGFGANFNPVVADFNADGLADIGYYDYNLAKVKYRINKGTIEATDIEFPTTFTLTGATIKIQSGDYNGDGIIDIVTYDDIGTCDLASSSGDPSDLLISISNGVGGTTDIAYASSAQFDNTNLPFVTNVVTSITNSAAQGDLYTSEYFYEGGLWDPLYREFKGFSKVTVKDPENNTTVSQFHQGHMISDKTESFSFSPWHAFDDYAEQTGYAFAAKSFEKVFKLQYGFGRGNEKIIKKYTVRSGSAGTPGSGAPHDWTFEGSNDDRNWVVLDTQVDQGVAVSDGNTGVYNSFTNDQAYAYYRLNVTKSGGSQYIYVYEMEMMDSPTSTEDLTSPIYDNGRLLSQASYDENGNLFSKTENTWAAELVTDFILFPHLKRKDNFVYDGDATGRRTAEEFFYEEATQYGNLTKAIQYGEVDLSDGSDIGTDKRTVETAYVNNTTDWIIGLPANTTVKDNAATQVRHTWFYYDNQLNTDPPIKGLLTKKEDWNGNAEGHANNPQTEYSYDAYGNLLTTSDPLDKVTTITYDTDYHLFPKQTQNALTHQVVNKYYGVEGEALDDGAGLKGLWGQLKATTDPNNHEGQRVYDTFGRLTATISPLDTVAKPTTTTEYELTSSYTKIKTSQRVEHGQDPTISASRFIDGLGRELQTKTPSGFSGQYVVRNQQEFNTRGLPQKQYLPYFTTNNLDVLDSIDTGKPKSTITYDAMGRAVTTTNPDGSYATIEYDDWTVRNINENGHKQESDFDAYGRLIEKREYTGADGRAATYYPLLAYTLYGTTKYTYDSEGNLTQTEDAHNNITTITYDDLGRKISMNDPDMGAWSYEYDLNGNLTKQTDAKNQVIDFTYDSLNRLTEKIETASQTLDVDYTYDAPSVSNSIGRLVTAVYGTNQDTSFEYDSLGRESKSTKTIDAQGFSVERTYDALNNIIQIQYPDATNIFYDYNDAGQIKAISNDPALFDQGAMLERPSGFGDETRVVNRQTVNVDERWLTKTHPGFVTENRTTFISHLASLFERYILGVKPAYADEYYLGQWEWCQERVDDGADVVIEEYWCAPVKEKMTGTIDLRSVPQMRKKADAQGFAIFSYSEPVTHPKLFKIESAADRKLNRAVKARLETDLGVTLEAENLKDILWELLTTKGDPTGETRWKPIKPDVHLKRNIRLGTEGKIREESFVPFVSAGTDLVFALEYENYKKMMQEEPLAAVAKHLDWLEEKYGVHYSHFIPKDKNYGYLHLASLPHETIITEDWDGADKSSSGCNMNEDLTWSCTTDKFWQNSNLAKTADTSASAIARAESDLSGSDMYCQIFEAFARSSTGSIGCGTRFDAAAETLYYGVHRTSSTSTYRIFKKVSGTQTELASADVASTSRGTVKFETDGSDLELFLDGASKLTVTDSSITGNTRAGAVHLGSRDVHVDNFEAADLTGGANQAPTVDAGADATINVWETMNLNGTMSDDGLPNPPATVTGTWSMTSGPGSVTFGDVNAVTTTATFSVSGTYVLRLTAGDSELSSYDECTATVNTLAAPTLNAPSAGDTQVSLSWNSVADATGYKVKYGTTSGSYPNVDDVGNVTNHTVTGLTNDTTYYFVVSAYNASVESVNSNEVSSTPTGAPVNTVYINFQPSASSTPQGYTKEDMQLYSGARGFGWESLTGLDSFEQSEVGDLKIDTYTRLTGQPSGSVTWKYDLPNGEYLISVATGNAKYYGGPHYIEVEGEVLVNWVTTQGNGDYEEVLDYPVTVTDGQLTVILKQGSQSYHQSAISYLIIKPQQAPPTLFVENVEYNAAGQITKIEYGNGTVTTREYNPLTLRLSRIHTVDAQLAALQDLNYTYDPSGNIVRIDDYVNTATQDFEYDALNRLTEAVGSYGTKTYSYDEIGNIITKDGLSYTYGEGSAGPHAVTSLSDNTTFTYDANGNMATKQKGTELTEYIYDSENQLIEVKVDSSSVATFAYDGDGGRVKKITSGGTTKYVGSLYEERGGTATSFIFLGDIRVASITGSDVRYYHQDHLGGTNVLTNDTGVKKELTEYEPFGTRSRHEMYGTGQEVAWFYFTGKELDDETGLIYFGARYYNPELGRFITPDTIVQNPSNPQTLNRYSYTANNPVNFVDPTGHFFKKIAKFFGKIIGAIAGAITFLATGNPVLAFSVFNITDSIVSGGIALASGADPGRIFGSIGLSILLNSAIPGAGEGLGAVAQIGINAVRGAAIAVATTAAIWGSDNLGIAAATGGAFAALGTFLATMESGTSNQAAEAETEVQSQQQTNDTQQRIDQKIMETNNKNDPKEFSKGVKDIKRSVNNTNTTLKKTIQVESTSLKESAIKTGINFQTIAIGTAELALGITIQAVSIGGLLQSGGISGVGISFGGSLIGAGLADIALGIYGKPSFSSQLRDAINQVENDLFGGYIRIRTMEFRK